MRVIDKSLETVKLSTIKVGQCFIYQHEIFMVTDGYSGSCNLSVVDLISGKLLSLNGTLDVFPCDGEFVITRKG